jgi:hypothetical protein
MPWKHFTAKWAVPKQDQYPVTCNHDKQSFNAFAILTLKLLIATVMVKETDKFVTKLRKMRTLCCVGIQDANTMIEHSLQKFEGDPKEDAINYTIIFKGLNDSKIKFENLKTPLLHYLIKTRRFWMAYKIKRNSRGCRRK